MSRVAVDAREAAPPWHYPSALVDRLTLADGRVVVMRPVQAFDALAEQDFIRALSPASRLKRFHFGLKELPPALLRAMTEVDHRQHVAVIAERLDSDDDGVTMVVADARYVIDADPHEAEFALAVADAWQGVGLGRARVLDPADQDVALLLAELLHGSVIEAGTGGEKSDGKRGDGDEWPDHASS